MKILDSKAFVESTANTKRQDVKFFNENSPIKHGGRKAPKGGREILEEVRKMDDYDLRDTYLYKNTEKACKDLSKYSFGFDNAAKI